MPLPVEVVRLHIEPAPRLLHSLSCVHGEPTLAFDTGKPASDVVMEYSCEENNLDNVLSGAIKPWRPPADDEGE